MKCVIGLLVLHLLTQCRSRGIPEESVISYQKSGTVSEDVYVQIATNIAEKLTTPIYSFFGFGRNRTAPLFKKRWNAIETLDESKEVTNEKPLDNGLEERDIEQLSLESLQKEDKKPEKIELLPKTSLILKHMRVNDSSNEVDSQEDSDFDSTDGKAKEGSLVYFLELAASFFQLILGAISEWFKSSSSS